MPPLRGSCSRRVTIREKHEIGRGIAALVSLLDRQALRRAVREQDRERYVSTTVRKLSKEGRG